MMLLYLSMQKVGHLKQRVIDLHIQRDAVDEAPLDVGTVDTEQRNILNQALQLGSLSGKPLDVVEVAPAV